MSAGSEKQLLLTFEGPVTVCFLDGQLLEGKLFKQDLFNYYLLVEGEPTMVSRSQVRYIRGESEQKIVPDVASQEVFLDVEPAPDLVVDKSAFDTAEVSRPPSEALEGFVAEVAAVDQDVYPAGDEGTIAGELGIDQAALEIEADVAVAGVEPEVEQPALEMTPEVAAADVEPETDQVISETTPEVAAADVEPEVYQSDPDLLADMLAEELALQAEQPTPEIDADRTALDLEPLNPIEDTGATFILAEPTEFVETVEPGSEEEPASPVYDWDDATMVLGEDEEGENEITAILGQETKPQTFRRLVFSTGPHAGEQIELSGETITLGRASDNDVSLNLDKEVSRRHAIIKLEAGRYVIQDHNSLNGTFVNNQRIDAPHPLEDGDVIFLGVSDIIYQEE